MNNETPTDNEALEAAKYWFDTFIEQYDGAPVTHETDAGEAAFIVEKELFEALYAQAETIRQALSQPVQNCPRCNHPEPMLSEPAEIVPYESDFPDEPPSNNTAIRELRRDSDNAYCRALDLADKNCGGSQYKLENGEFGNDDLKWHCKHNELIGFHRGICHALRALDTKAIEASKEGEQS